MVVRGARARAAVAELRVAGVGGRARRVGDGRDYVGEVGDEEEEEEDMG